MRILIVAPDFYPTNGGYANATTNFVKALKEEDVDIYLYTSISLNNKEELKIENLHIIRRPASKFFLATGLWELFSYFKLSQFIKNKKIDCIFFETGEFGLLGYLLSRKFRNVVVRIHATTETEVAIFGKKIYDKFHSFFIKLFFKRVTWVLSTNSFHLEFYKKYFLKNDIYKIAKKKFFVVPNIINEFEIDTIVRNNVFEKYDLGSLKNCKILFSLGRMDYLGLIQKGMEDLIFAIYLLKHENIDVLKNVKIILVGKGGYSGHIKKIISGLGLSDFFILLESIANEDVLKFVSISSGVVLLSRFEGLSMFALESLYVGSPLIFSKNGGIVDLVVEKQNGYLVDVQNLDMIKLALFEVLNKNNREIEKMRQLSHSHFEHNFSSKKIINKFINIMNLVINS